MDAVGSFDFFYEFAHWGKFICQTLDKPDTGRRMHLLLCVSDIIDSITMAIFGGRVPSQRNLSKLIQQNAILYAFAWRYHYSIHLPQFFFALHCVSSESGSSVSTE